MKRLAIALVVVLATATMAAAEHDGPPAGDKAIDVNVRIGTDGFRLGGRVLGLERVYGAWLNGHAGRDGLSLDGRLQGGEKAYSFRLNADAAEGLARGALRWWLEPR